MDEPEIIHSLRILHDLTKAINSTLEPGVVEQMVLEKASELMKAKRTLLLLKKEDNVLQVHSSLGFDDTELIIKQFENTRSFDHCIVHKGTVIKLKEVLSESDFVEALRTVPSLEEMVFAPLEIQGEAYGLLGISGGRRTTSQIDLEIFCSLASQSAIAIENANLYKTLKETFLQTAEALGEAINSRDPYTGGHTYRVKDYALQLADKLNLAESDMEFLNLAAALHDIGKIGIDDTILRKGGRLSPEETQIMRTHPDIGANILRYVDGMRNVLPGVLHHHERFDGSGYPAGLKGEEIPLSARIIAIADAFDALTTERPYKKASDHETALRRLKDDSGAHFDPELVTIFCEIINTSTINSASILDETGSGG